MFQIKETKVNNIIDPTYFSDVDIFDFGSLLVYQKDKRFDLMHYIMSNNGKCIKTVKHVLIEHF